MQPTRHGSPRHRGDWIQQTRCFTSRTTSSASRKLRLSGGRRGCGLCRLIEYTPNAAQIPLRLLNLHVEAVRAIYREYARSDAQQLAAMLTRRLGEVTDELLISQKRGWPEVLA